MGSSRRIGFEKLVSRPDGFMELIPNPFNQYHNELSFYMDTYLQGKRIYTH